jgi:two-component system nitrogen regulation response regulator NtrX
VLPISIPPLRERPEDIPHLVADFLGSTNNNSGKSKMILESDIEELKKLKWPGNVRELLNAISFLVSTSEGNILDLRRLKFDLQEMKLPAKKSNDYDTLKFKNLKEEKALIEMALKSTANLSASARKLGMKRSTLRDKIKKYGIVIETGNETQTEITEEI